MIVNHETNSIAVLPRLYVLISANILPKRYNGTNIFVAGSKIVNARTALPVTSNMVSATSE